MEFIRLFDVADHDPALTWRQWHTFQDRMTKLFLNGQLFMGPNTNPGMTPLQIIWEAAKATKPIYYGDNVVHLFSKPSRDAMRAMADSIQQVTQVALERLDVEFDVSRPEVAFTVFDLGRWTDSGMATKQNLPKR